MTEVIAIKGRSDPVISAQKVLRAAKLLGHCQILYEISRSKISFLISVLQSCTI